MNSNWQAFSVVVGALVLGAAFQLIAQQEAMALGLTAVELGLLSVAAGTVATRLVATR